jgi:flagellar assembly factor FliW
LEIQTSRFGSINVQDEKMILFPKGILGFSQNKRYILFPHSERSPFYWLQSVEDGAVAFVVMSPQLVKEDYTVNIETSLLKELHAEEVSELEVMCIVNIPQNQPDKMTINLLGPIIINVTRRCGVQIICPDENYSHRHPVIAQKG